MNRDQLRPMLVAGLRGGCSRLPSRDDVVTPEIRGGFRELLAQASVNRGPEAARVE